MKAFKRGKYLSKSASRNSTITELDYNNKVVALLGKKRPLVMEAGTAAQMSSAIEKFLVEKSVRKYLLRLDDLLSIFS